MSLQDATNVLEEFSEPDYRKTFGYLIRYSPRNNELDGGVYWIDFEAYDIVGLGEDDKPLFTEKGSCGANDVVESPGDAERFLHGHIKWDGCSHWMFDENTTDTMIHLCGVSEMRSLARLFEKMFEIAGRLMPEAGEDNE